MKLLLILILLTCIWFGVILTIQNDRIEAKLEQMQKVDSARFEILMKRQY